MTIRRSNNHVAMPFSNVLLFKGCEGHIVLGVKLQCIEFAGTQWIAFSGKPDVVPLVNYTASEDTPSFEAIPCTPVSPQAIPEALRHHGQMLMATGIVDHRRP